MAFNEDTQSRGKRGVRVAEEVAVCAMIGNISVLSFKTFPKAMETLHDFDTNYWDKRDPMAP